MDKITIHPSPTADSRTCDPGTVTESQLWQSSQDHIQDVRKGLWWLAGRLQEAGEAHDADKLADIKEFHEAFQQGIMDSKWLAWHYRQNRHHLQNPAGVPEDVNLIDVLEMVVDCVMAGMARSGSVFPIELPAEVLQRALNNTVELLKQNTEVLTD